MWEPYVWGCDVEECKAVLGVKPRFSIKYVYTKALNLFIYLNEVPNAKHISLITPFSKTFTSMCTKRKIDFKANIYLKNAA